MIVVVVRLPLLTGPIYVERRDSNASKYSVPEVPASIPPGGQLLALVDALRSGTLNDSQTETMRALRAGVLALVERESVLLDTDRQYA